MNRTALIETLRQTRERTLSLLLSLGDEQLRVPYDPGINPPVWELGHAAFFYEYFILQYRDGAPSIDPSMDQIWDSFELDHEDRWTPGLFPDKEGTLRYFKDVYARIEQRIREKPLTDRDLYLYRYALFHQHMHIESMTWCRQTLGYPAPPESGARPVEDSVATVAGDVRVPGGDYRIGMPAQSPDFARDDFAFDNEKPQFTRRLDSFLISPMLVSNAEFLAFVEDGGYRRDELWSMGGRKWRDTRDARNPRYWRHEAGQWLERHFDQWLPLAPRLPVRHVSYWEADAFCRWAGRRLPTEFEWEAAALGNRPGEPRRRFPWGDTPDSRRVDMDNGALGRLPVDAFAEGDSPFGCRQMLGTVWEWTSSQFLPYDGFAVDMYPFMSTLQFGDHKTTRGGSCATSSALIRGTYRQAYHPDRDDVFVGFRTCAVESPS